MKNYKQHELIVQETNEAWNQTRRETLFAAIRELERELAMRQQLYPKWVKQGSLRKPVARKQIHYLKAAIAELTQVQLGLEDLP